MNKMKRGFVSHRRRRAGLEPNFTRFILVLGKSFHRLGRVVRGVKLLIDNLYKGYVQFWSMEDEPN